MTSVNASAKTGMIYATLAYFSWGFFPIYWKFLKHVPTLQILGHRVLWAFFFYSVVRIFKDRSVRPFWPETTKKALLLSLASLLLMVNWLVYIYAVNTNQIIESSLGYFINPLVNILIGVFFLRERLTRYQTIAAILAGVGVLVISMDQGRVPWIALALAITFSIYGLIKKLNPISGIKSNQFESMIAAPFALGFLLTQNTDWLTTENTWWSVLLLVGSGVITGMPLIFFAEATQRIPYYLMGFFQFMTPILQFATGIFIFGEPLSLLKLKGFAFIWLAGFILVFSAWWARRRKTISCDVPTRQ